MALSGLGLTTLLVFTPSLLIFILLSCIASVAKYDKESGKLILSFYFTYNYEIC